MSIYILSETTRMDIPGKICHKNFAINNFQTPNIWSMNSGRPRARDYQNLFSFTFIFNPLQQMDTKLGQFTKLKTLDPFLHFLFCKVS